MGVARQLGLEDEASELLVLADERWDGWTRSQPALAAVAGVQGLRPWLRSAEYGDADDVLHALATLAATDGADDVAAAAALAWALVPGACTLANRLRTLSPHIDAVVAAQLWVEARTFPWRRLGKVAANILMNTRVGVLRECGVKSHLDRTDRTWSNTSPVNPCGPFWGGYVAAGDERSLTATEELFEILEWARGNDVISDDDRMLLLCLLEAADRAATTRVGRGYGGLMANDVSDAVAQQWGVSSATVRRRARRTVRALSSACARSREWMPA